MENILQTLQELNQKILQVNSLIEEELKRLNKEDEASKKKEELEDLAQKLSKVQIGSNRIKLDVGGQIFSTSLKTLNSQKGSFFEAMFSGKLEIKPEDDGCYFIDRDPTVFGHILNYLRGQPPTLDILSTKELFLLKQDAEFYQLPGLSEYLHSLCGTASTPSPVSAPIKYRFVSGPNYTVSSDGLQITKTSQSQYDMTATTTPIPSSGIHHLKLNIANSQNGNIMVGVCPSSINKSQEYNYKHCGWYFNCYNGNLYSGPPHSVSNKSYYSTSAIGTGREVGVKMDMTNGQISFTIDRVDRGVAFTNISVNQSLSFCVVMLREHDSVRIVE